MELPVELEETTLIALELEADVEDAVPTGTPGVELIEFVGILDGIIAVSAGTADVETVADMMKQIILLSRQRGL